MLLMIVRITWRGENNDYDNPSPPLHHEKFHFNMRNQSPLGRRVEKQAHMSDFDPSIYLKITPP